MKTLDEALQCLKTTTTTSENTPVAKIVHCVDTGVTEIIIPKGSSPTVMSLLDISQDLIASEQATNLILHLSSHGISKFGEPTELDSWIDLITGVVATSLSYGIRIGIEMEKPNGAGD